MSTRKWDPNPTRGQASIFDKVQAAVVLLVSIPLTLFRVSLRRLYHVNNLPFKVDFRRTLMRSGTFYIPLSIKRMVLTFRSIPAILNSNRFKPVPGPLCEEVLEKDLAGFWVCRGLAKKRRPSECDLVVLYLHGGAFVLGHPMLASVSQLRMAEIAEQHGFSIAIYSVNYTLAPEAKFPTQRDEVIAAYEYLLERENIDPSRVVICGQSAGGYLAMSFLDTLASEQLPKPGAAWLMYPWVDLTNSGVSFEQNQYNDTLNKLSLDRAARSFLGDDHAAVMDWAKVDNLGSILPKYTWTTVGTYDSFYDSVDRFVQSARAGGADIDLIPYDKGTHAWDAELDFADTTAYLSLDSGAESGKLMAGAEHMAEGLLQIRKKLRN